MARIFITGSSTGLGLFAGRHLARQGHEVVLHARNNGRASGAMDALPEAKGIVIGDIETIQGAVEVAAGANDMGPFDAVIHNAGIYGGERRQTADGPSAVFAVNTLAPYILTSLIARPQRLVYLSSSMHLGVNANLDDMLWEKRRWSGATAYSESKLHILLLAFGVSRLWPEVKSNGVDPGWVPTRMGGPGAPDDLREGALTQAALAAPEADSPLANANGCYFHHLRAREPDPQSRDMALQDLFLARCRELCGYEIA